MDRSGFDPLDVPDVKIFVARKSEQVDVFVAWFGHAHEGQFIAPTQQARARPMLEAAVAVHDGGDLKQITRKRRGAVLLGAEEIDLPLADACQVARQTVDICATPAAGERDFMLRASGDKRRGLEIGNFDGASINSS